MKTAIEWLESQLKKQAMISVYNFEDQLFYTKLIKEAKAMEKEQIKATAIKCHFEGVRQSAKTSEEYITYSEEYYNETYKKDAIPKS